MKILLIGSGGREHSLSIKLNESPRLSKLFIAPGNAGTSEIGENIPVKETDIYKLLDFAQKEKIDLTIVGPEAPLVAGIVDIFVSHGLRIIGPYKNAAMLEGSKEWAKQIMKECNIPTAKYERFNTFQSALHYLTRKNEYPVVVKADVLASGKGVTVAFSEKEAKHALERCFIQKVFDSAGLTVIIEDFLEGEEASILAFTDGETVYPLAPAQDHKPLYDNDKGPNTGGMGAYSPAPVVTTEIEKIVLDQIFYPLINGLKEKGITYKGIIYAGLMINDGKPYVVEFNVRFGDPETQVVIPRLKNDIIDIFEAIENQTLSNITLEWEENAAVCVILASKGYPEEYEKNKVITGIRDLKNNKSIQVIHAGTKSADNKLLTCGGRVIGVVGLDKDIETAISRAYEAVDKITFENKYNRLDIGSKALNSISI